MSDRFCPRCGKGLRDSECEELARFGFITQLRCKICHVPVETSGGVFLTICAILISLSYFIIALDRAFFQIACGFFAFGALRYIRQYRAQQKYKHRVEELIKNP